MLMLSRARPKRLPLDPTCPFYRLDHITIWARSFPSADLQ
jgi:hypothetical protein